MKTRFTYLALSALCWLMGSSAWAIEPVDGVYKIGSAAELKEFALLVQEGNVAINAELTADIVYTGENFERIGYKEGDGFVDTSYKGTFDGKGHTITLDIETDESNGGTLFHQIGDGGVVKNLVTAGVIKSSAQNAAGVAKRLITDGALINVVSKVNIVAVGFIIDEATGEADCSHAGLVARVEKYPVEMTNCAFIGKFSGAGTHRGGLVSWVEDTKLMVNNCMVVAELDNDVTLDENGNLKGSNAYFRYNTNAGNKPTLTNTITTGGFSDGFIGGITVDPATIASGEACFILNGRQSETPTWYQTLGTDAYPTVDATHGVVYANGKQHCDGSDYVGETVYSNTNTGIQKDEHNFQDGICDFCHAANPDHLTADAEGYYNLASTGDMQWFAAMVNSGVNPGINGRITEELDFNGVEWTPIGIRTSNYTGKFDGQLKAITNLNGMLFGTTGAGANITGIALESATTWNDNTDIAQHTGSIIGFANGETTLTYSYSKATFEGSSKGDKAGISGKFWGTMDHVYFAGPGTSGLSGLIGSSSEGVRPAHLKNCFVAIEAGTKLTGWAGGLVGWMHGNGELTNCFLVAETVEDVTFWEYNESPTTNLVQVTYDQVANGELTWMLNGNSFKDATWFQTIDEDMLPMLSKDHGLVYPKEEGYASSGDDISEMKEYLLGVEAEYIENVLAYQATIDAYSAAVENLQGVSDRDEFVAAYYAAMDVRKDVETSAKAYQAYVDAVEDVYAKAKASGLSGENAQMIYEYYEGTVEPGETFPNGSFEYIKTNKQLTNEQIAAEAEFIKALLEQAIIEDYKVGDEITNLLVNATLKETPNFTGWTYEKEGSTFTVGKETREIMPAAESWQASYDLHQTVKGLKDGLYELQVNAAWRGGHPSDGGGDFYNENYSAWAYAGANSVYVMTEGEDAILKEDAVDGKNAYLDNSVYGGLVDNEYDGDYYIPAGPQSCTFAFKGGRYVNTIVALVQGGELTVGLRNIDQGITQGNWTGFGNFRLFYRGDITSTEASASLDATLKGMAARATTLINYEPSSSLSVDQPSYSKAIKAQLQDAIAAIETATTGEQKYDLVQKFTALYQQAYDSKQVYKTILAEILGWGNTAQSITNMYPEVEEMANALSLLTEDMIDRWMDGAYTDMASAMAEIEASALYKWMQENLPAQKEGYYELASLNDYKWFAEFAAAVPNANGRLVAAIDFGEEGNPTIGTSEVPFAGNFDGQLYALTNVNAPLFGVTKTGTLEGLAIESGNVNKNTSGAGQTGAFVGLTQGTTILNSYTKATVSGGGGDIGGMIGKTQSHTVIRNCLFAGNITTGWSASCIMGSTDGGSSIAEVGYCIIDASNVTYGNGDGHGLVCGWQHDDIGSSTFHDLYCIAGANLTNLYGHKGNNPGVNIASYSAEEMASGAIAYAINELQGKTVWYQTLGEDATPVLLSDHKVVYKNEDGTYTNESGDAIEMVEAEETLAKTVNVYDINGRLIRTNVKTSNSLNGLPAGIYVIGGKKALVK